VTPKQIYLLFCVIGFLIPYAQFAPWVAEHGLDMRLFLSELGATRISRFFAWDVMVSAAVLVAFMRIERRRTPVKNWWMAAAGTLLVGVSFGLPFFLYLREDSLKA
jgi:hypothetical protein